MEEVSQYSIKYRPTTFEDIYGQKEITDREDNGKDGVTILFTFFTPSLAVYYRY